MLTGKCDINRGYSLPLDVTVSEESSSAPGCAGQSGISICKQVNYQNFHSGRNYKINLFFHKKSLEFREVLFGGHILLNTNSQ